MSSALQSSVKDRTLLDCPDTSLVLARVNDCLILLKDLRSELMEHLTSLARNWFCRLFLIDDYHDVVAVLPSTPAVLTPPRR